MLSLRSQVMDQANIVSSNIEHGECFYSQHELDELLTELDKLKELAVAYFKENREEIDNDDN